MKTKKHKFCLRGAIELDMTTHCAADLCVSEWSSKPKSNQYDRIIIILVCRSRQGASWWVVGLEGGVPPPPRVVRLAGSRSWTPSTSTWMSHHVLAMPLPLPPSPPPPPPRPCNPTSPAGHKERSSAYMSDSLVHIDFAPPPLRLLRATASSWAPVDRH